MAQRKITLILKYNTNDDKFKSRVGKSISTTVYADENDDDNEKEYEKIEEDEIGITDDMAIQTKKRIIELRNYLVDTCHSIFDLINSNTVKISNEHINELKDYIDDILVWIHVKRNLVIKDYVDKINMINNECERVMTQYNNDVYDNKLCNKRWS